MTKAELLERLKDVSDDTELQVVSSECKIHDDLYWTEDYQTNIQDIIIDKEFDDVYIVLDASEFM